jgi:choline dehydrogenase-like flavoprotein
MRLSDLNQLDDGTVLEADLCIVGSGPAGMSVAAEFAYQKVDVILLESGGIDDESSTDALYEIESVGARRILDQQNLRRRILGGSSHVWTGRCAPFDPIDFAKRPWIANSGWPISRDDIQPYFERSGAYLGLGVNIYDDTLWPHLGANRPSPELNVKILEPRFWQFSKGYHFRDTAAHFGIDAIRSRSENIRVILHANLTQINLNDDGSSFESIDVAALSGKRVRVRSRVLVLGCGGVENARLLLASNKQLSSGVGNHNDQVGRYFMDHTDCAVGYFDLDRTYQVRSRFGGYWLDDDNGRHVYMHGFGLSAEAQRTSGLLNGHAYIEEIHDPRSGWQALRRLRSSLRQRKARAVPPDIRRAIASSPELLSGLYRRLLKHRPAMTKLQRLELHCILEQEPNPNSRITLSTKRDALEVPLSKIDWKISELEQRTVVYLTDSVCAELKRIGLAVPRIQPWLRKDHGWSSHCVEKAHPSGTTRMSQDPRRGVVDPNCQVHGIRGLYVIGSSVFPTSGAANPTFMIVAMAIRLADHLKNEVFTNKVALRPSVVRVSPRSTAPVRIGIVGAGHRVRDFYVPVLQALGDQYQTVGFTTRSPRTAQRLELASGIRSFADVRELVAKAKPTFLIVAVADRQNEATVLDLLDLGVPILAETPLAWSVEGMRKIIKKATTNKVIVGVAEQWPLFPLEQLRGALIQHGVFGSIRSVQDDFQLYRYHAIAQLRAYLEGNPTKIVSLQSWSEDEQGEDVSWQAGKVLFDSGAVLNHNYARTIPSASSFVRICGERATMTNSELVFISPSERKFAVDRKLTRSGNLIELSIEALGAGVIAWKNPYSDHAFSDEHIAIAAVLDGMSKAVLSGMAPTYTCEKFLTDMEVVRALYFSEMSGGRSISLPLNEKWQKVRLLTSAHYLSK